MNEIEKGCYSFIKKLTQELTQDYEIQYYNMEEFVRWNLPDEIALEWIDAEGMIEILEKGNCLSDELLKLLKLIISNFNSAFEQEDYCVYTHDAMKSSDFWNEQRRIATKALDIM